MEGKSASSRLSTKDEWTSQVGCKEDTYILAWKLEIKLKLNFSFFFTDTDVLNYLQIAVQPLDDIKLRGSLRALKDLVQTALGPNGR